MCESMEPISKMWGAAFRPRIWRSALGGTVGIYSLSGLVKRGESRHEVAVARVEILERHRRDDGELALAVKGLAVDVYKRQERRDALRPCFVRCGGERPCPCSTRRYG